MSESAAENEPLPPIRTDPRFGYYPRWPEDGDAWVHPEDAALARRLIPSTRIWRVEETGGDLAGRPLRVLRYGELRLRVAPALWQETPEPTLAIGDWVEVSVYDHRRQPHTGQVREVRWDDYTGAIVYQLTEQGQPLPGCYRAEELIAIDPPTSEPGPVVKAPSAEELRSVDEMVEGLEVDQHQKGENRW